ncbi:hypothetical protein D9M71_512870 [compost metagenome]
MFVVEWQLGLRQPVLMAFLRQMAAHFDLHQVFGQQQVEAVLAQHQLAQQGVGNAVGVLCQGRQSFTLAWCAGDTRIIQARPRGNLPEALLAGLGRFALAQQHRQGPAQGVAKAVLVVLSSPQAQLEQCRGQRRNRVEQGNCRLEFVSRNLTLVADFDQDADHFPPPEGHADTHARGQRLACHARWRPVVEQSPQGRGQGEAQNDVGHAKSSLKGFSKVRRA